MRYDTDCKRLAPTYVYLFQYVTFVVFVLSFYYGFAIYGTVAFARGDTITVQIDGLAQPPGFFPNFLTLHVNDTVVFVNHAYPANSYTISADDGSFSSQPIAPGGQWKVTFLSKGSHVYRDATSPQRMVGELLVLDSGVSLLPTPAPFVEATVIATIKDRKNPPDSIVLPVIAHAAPPPPSSLVPLVILVVVISGGMIVLGAVGFAYYQRYQQRTALPDEDEDQTGPLPTPALKKRMEQTSKLMKDLKKKLQAHSPFRTRKPGEEDDEEYDDWDQL
jgi:plastocyanin